ncbi:MAG: hypothetical protein AUJ85_06105 [Elusimicrobia bacterium CG1_02_37_114]|nr:MAG: hypothetical protein AUJ85_06105 [Elusimicrobia bacterium CG1_02_37_114]PIV52763.1 MAG: hypothetical protein COS17_07425 [Elusimicrobia bacterium CG02_land_8_20_14_3_00_37_13]PIZ12681.1 MAG: hypothetical protein COY53_08755 [Elusimicrobia bacterium CG_4_10_14_0_8_um_filter_37_32]
MNLDKNFFTRQPYSKKELEKHYVSAGRNLKLAGKNNEPEIKFHFTYMALLKIGIYCIAKTGYRVKSRSGHHIKIIETLSKILNNDEILVLGDTMRKNRNKDLYFSDAIITEKEANYCFDFVSSIYNNIKP